MSRAKTIRFSKRDLEIISQALAIYDAEMEDNQTDENGYHSNQLYAYHVERFGDANTTLDLVRQKVHWKLRRLETGALV